MESKSIYEWLQAFDLRRKFRWLYRNISRFGVGSAKQSGLHLWAYGPGPV